MGRVDGKVALISGAARGMGASHARLLVAEGARVVLGDILDDEGAAVAAELGDAARFVHLDVTRPEDWQRAVEVATAEFGRLDVLVNNAGLAKRGSTDGYGLEDWYRIVDINLNGTYLGIHAALPALKTAGGGSIINISSMNGIMGGEKQPAYIASKFGVTGLTKATAIDLAPFGIRVNSVHPGVIRTPMTEWRPRSASHTAMNRMGEPIEVSRTVLFLASDESSFSTGAEFVVDGGETAGRVTDEP